MVMILSSNPFPFLVSATQACAMSRPKQGVITSGLLSAES